MDVRTGDGPWHGPCLTLTASECELLYEALRRWMLRPGDYDGRTPTLAQTWRWLDGLSFYHDLLHQAADGELMSGNVFHFADGAEPVKGAERAP
jgi:hypothetical protein